MRLNRRHLIVGLVLGIMTGGLLTHAVRLPAQEPPKENQDWIPAEPEEEPPAEDPFDEALGEIEGEEQPLGEPEVPLEDPAAMPEPEPVEAPVVEEPVRVPEPPRKAPAVAKKPAKPAGETFRVRLAEAGKGFRQGVAGKLRVTSSGLAFTRDGGRGADWSISWKDLQVARKEGGLWDAPFVLGLVQQDGSRRYVVRLDTDGRYLDGAPILAAIVRSGGARFK